MYSVNTNYTRQIIDDYCVLDTETTGLSAYYDEIIEIGILKVRNNEIVDRYDQLIKPSIEVDDFITSLTGITNEMLKGMPSIADVKTSVLSFIGEDIILGHNTSFDMRFLNEGFKEQLTNRYMDTMQFARKLYPELQHHRLSDLTDYLGLHNNEHRALSDCTSTKELYDAVKASMAEKNLVIEDLWPASGSHSGKGIDIKAIKPDEVVVDKDGFFYNRHVVFTGKHEFTIELNKDYVTANMTAGSKHRFQVRFEGTVSKNAPTDHSVDNQWGLKLNNSLTSSNVVSNKPVEPKPEKKDETKTGINIDGKTAYVGDDIYYRLTLSAATLKDTAYKVHRLGMIDDYDDEYLQLNDKNIEILDAAGKDVTNKFNIQVKDGVVYVFAKTVDTEYLGDILPGDPQPTDLKAYAGKVLDVTKDPAIDQSLLGQDYTIVLPMTVKQVKDGYVVKNTATQITNDRKDVTNTVTNPLKVINPKKDVTVKVNGESANGKSIYKDHQFLYRLDSSKIAGNRAYKQIKNWRIVDDYDEKFDKLTGQWAVYVNNDIKLADGTVISKGSRIDGSGVDAGYFTFTEANGAFTVEATQQFLDIASAMDSDLSWTAYVQMTRLGVSDRVENTFVETMNDVERESNMVWTKTPDQTPAIKLIKYDAASGLEAGDRNTPSEALKSTKNGTKIVFRIINTGKVNLTKITLDDKTIAGSGTVTNLEYPANWSNLVLKPGEYVEVKGTLTGMNTMNHTDRGHTTGTPIVPCASHNDHPFDPNGGDNGNGGNTGVCYDTPVEDSDDWNGVTAAPLAQTGSAVVSIAIAALAALGAGASIMITKRNKKNARKH